MNEDVAAEKAQETLNTIMNKASHAFNGFCLEKGIIGQRLKVVEKIVRDSIKQPINAVMQSHELLIDKGKAIGRIMRNDRFTSSPEDTLSSGGKNIGQIINKIIRDKTRTSKLSKDETTAVQAYKRSFIIAFTDITDVPDVPEYELFFKNILMEYNSKSRHT